MKMRWSLMAVVVMMAGCSQIDHTDQTKISVNKTTNAAESGLYHFGENQGCAAAFGAHLTEAQGLSKAPANLTGTKADYHSGWTVGFDKCRVGLGPVKLPANSPTIVNPALYNYGYDLGCKSAASGTMDPQAGLVNAPAHGSDTAPYFLGWKNGYLSCHVPTKNNDVVPLPKGLHRFTNMFQYGYSLGCKGASDSSLTAARGLITPPILEGTKAQYMSGWQLGYHNCKTGASPLMPSNSN